MVQVRELASALGLVSILAANSIENFPVWGRKPGQALEGLPRMNLLGTFSATRRL